jgi:hypothetical protein
MSKVVTSSLMYHLSLDGRGRWAKRRVEVDDIQLSGAIEVKKGLGRDSAVEDDVTARVRVFNIQTERCRKGKH